MVYTHFKTFYIDLNNDNKTDIITLSSSLPQKASFNRISIAMSGAKKATFKANDQWAEIEPEFLKTNKNLVKSQNIFIKKTKIHTVNIVSGGTDGAIGKPTAGRYSVQVFKVFKVFKRSTRSHVQN